LTLPYDNDGLHFHLTDPLGTRRVRTDYAGVVEQTCQSLPFGSGLSCTNSSQYPTEHHFTGKERDTESGNDYFGARYYASSMGRFMSPDPLENVVADVSTPQSWDAYSYVLGNPLNKVDPTGTCDVVIGGITQSPNGPGTAEQQKFANADGAISAFPYAGGSIPGGVSDVVSQSAGPNGATFVAMDALRAAAQTPGSINVFTFSGGAQAFISAMALLPGLAGRINNVTYLSPGVGSSDTLLYTGNGETTAMYGQGGIEGLVTPNAGGSLFNLQGINRGSTGCKHDADCIFTKNAAFLKKQSGTPCTAPTIKTYYRGQNLIQRIGSNFNEFDWLPYLLNPDNDGSSVSATWTVSY